MPDHMTHESLITEAARLAALAAEDRAEHKASATIRDEAILTALQAGAGIRELARACGVDVTIVSRLNARRG